MTKNKKIFLHGLEAKNEIFARTKSIYKLTIDMFKYQQTTHYNVTCGFLQ